ncbi:MAG: outer membrane beta-barrel protein [Pseudomonadota bacterium]
MRTLKQIGIVFLLCLFGSNAFAECRYDFVPGLSVVGTYDDNIFLGPANEISDFTTALSPLASFNVQCATTGVSLSYQPAFVFYRRYTEYDTIRHSAGLNAFYQAGAYTRVELQDNFYRTEESREPLETIYATRRDRNPYFRNTCVVKLSHQFGPKDNLFAGYDDNHLENKDPLVEDVRIQTPFFGLAYWFDVKNGLDLNVRYSISDYDRSPDFKQNNESLRLTHLLTESSSISLDYNHTGIDYKPGRDDYEVHGGNASYSTTVWQYYRLGAGIGYYAHRPEQGDTTSGVTYNADFGRGGIEFGRATLAFGLQNGYRQEFADAENSGFVNFWSSNGSITYLVTEDLTASAGLSHRRDEFTEQAGRKDTVWTGSAGIVYNTGRWLALSINGQHMERDSSISTEDYDDNRVIVAISVRDRMR